MNSRALFAGVLALAGCAVGGLAHAAWFDDYTPEEKNTLTLFFASLALDYGTTNNFLAQGGHELNPIVGPYPDRARLNLMFAGTAVGTLTVSYLLPHAFRSMFHIVILSLDGTAVANNLKLRGGFHLRW